MHSMYLDSVNKYELIYARVCVETFVLPVIGGTLIEFFTNAVLININWNKYCPVLKNCT